MANKKQGFADEAFCPHLGCSHDQATRYMFPNQLHICLKTTPPGNIVLEYQEKHCLTFQHKECPLFKTASGAPFPAIMRREETIPILKNKARRSILLVIVAILAIGGTLGLLFFRKADQGSPSAEALAAPMITHTPTAATETSIPTPTKTILPTRTPTATVTPTTTATQILSPTPGPALGTPFVNFVLHQVQAGESLAMIAIEYQTTVERIEAANVLREGRSVWPDDILVIPIGAETEREVRFQYVLVEEDTDLADLAKAYQVASEELREYNRLGPLDWIPAGRWLILPVAGE